MRQLNELLLLRNRIDMNGADIPIIVVNWSQKEIDDAMAYWVDLSKDEWSVEEANARCMSQFLQREISTF
jgi:hypothetical protein